MATATNPTDRVQRVAITSGAWTEVTISGDGGCLYASGRQDPTETQTVILLKYRSDAGGEAADAIPAGGSWQKGNESPRRGSKSMKKGDTLFYAQSVAASATLVIREHEI